MVQFKSFKSVIIIHYEYDERSSLKYQRSSPHQIKKLV